LVFSRQLSYEVAVLAILCSTALFFFPAVRGPYSAVHGPVTALRSIQKRLRIWLVMALAALHVFGGRLTACHFVLWMLLRSVLSSRWSPPESALALRC
jgi:hypothetical protein